jgi:hypothetical protein
MALLTRPLTEAEAIILRDWMKAPSLPGFEDLVRQLEPQNCAVNYSAAHNRCSYIPPDLFYWWFDPGPSDCTWIVPGTRS